MQDALIPTDGMQAALTAKGGMADKISLTGHFDFRCLDNQGNVVWEDGFDNLVTTVGQNMILANGVSASAPAYMGLISGNGWSAVSAADTMSSHSGWNEAQNSGANTPPYGTTRPTVTWAAISGGSIATSAALSFVFTNSGTVEGGFICTGTGASATVGNTSGTLMSAGTLASPRTVANTDTLNVTYTLTLLG